ncbi:MAG: hypothetical protein ABIM89_08450 [Mycobacteriales bacterium]
MSAREFRKVSRWLGAVPVGAHCTDAELLALVERQKPQALQELYRRHAPLLFGVARRTVGVSGAERAISALFLQIWATPESFTPDAGSLRRVLLTRTVSLAAGAPPPPEERAWALLTVGRCTFAEAARLLGVPESVVRQQALAAFRARSGTPGDHTQVAG